MGLSTSTCNVWTLPSVKRMFIADERRWSGTCETDVHESASDDYSGQVLDNGQVHLLEETTGKRNILKTLVQLTSSNCEWTYKEHPRLLICFLPESTVFSI